MRGLTYSYGDNTVLHEVNLRVRAGERVALVGASGAGKSTLAAVIAGVHRVSTGDVTTGGIPVDYLAPGVSTMITQATHVFAGSIADNLRLVCPHASDEKLRAALRRVGATWVADLHERVGDLTTVQSQQLSLARLVLADPLVALVDEPAAECRGVARAAVDSAVHAALEGRTAIVVAHRLSDARTSDRVVVLSGGLVVENGTHGQLIARGGHYAQLWSAWSRSRVPAHRIGDRRDL